MPISKGDFGSQRKPVRRETGTSTKTTLAAELNKLIDARNLSQVEAAALMGMTQPKVSQIRRYRLKNISLERLIQALIAFDQRVEIVIRPAEEKQTAAVIVAA